MIFDQSSTISEIVILQKDPLPFNTNSFAVQNNLHQKLHNERCNMHRVKPPALSHDEVEEDRGTPQKPRHPKSIETPSQATSLKRERFVPVFSTVSDGIGIYGVVASVPVTWPILRRGFLYVVADDASGGSVLRFPRTSAFIISFDHNAHRNVSLVDRAWRSDAPAAGCRTRLAPCNNINNGEREKEREYTQNVAAVYTNVTTGAACASNDV